jgi:hypothetical protein
MSKPYLKLLLTVLTGLGLAACSGNSNDVNDDAPLYVPSMDTHPCLGVAVVSPSVIELGAEITVRIEVNNRCDEAVLYTSSTPPYFVKLVSSADRVVWGEPRTITTLLGEYSVAANSTTSYEMPITVSSDRVVSGTYRLIAHLSVDRNTDPAQYVEPLRLESEPRSVEVIQIPAKSSIK